MLAEQTSLVPSATISARSFEYSSGPFRLEGSLYSLGVGLTGIMNRVYLDISAERNLEPGEQNASTDLSPSGIEFNRQDTSLALGYAVNDSISVFGGYKHGKTTITVPGTLTVRELATSLKGQGPYFGAGGGWQVKDWGFFSFSAAYARLDAILQDQNAVEYDGNASGTSLGLEWKASLDKNLYYELAITHHHYFYQDFPEFGSDVTERILSLKLGIGYHF